MTTEDAYPRDFQDRPITPGRTIVYPGRSGSSLWMTEAIVENVYKKTSYRGQEYWTAVVVATGRGTGWGASRKKGARSRLERLDRVVVVG